MSSATLPLHIELRFIEMRQAAIRAGRCGDIQGLLKLANMAIYMAQSGTGLAMLNQRSEIAAVQAHGDSLTARHRLMNRALPPSTEAQPER
jgi:hypothetical protein